MSNKTTMSIRDFVIIYNLVEAEMRDIKSGCCRRVRTYYSPILNRDEFDAKVEEQLKNDMRYQDLLSIIQKLGSMSIDVNVPDVEIEDKTDNLTN